MFDRNKKTEFLTGPLGTQRLLSKDTAVVRKNNALGTFGRIVLTDAIFCYLCHLVEDAEELVEFSSRLLEESLETKEAERKADRHGEYALCFYCLAMCNWFLGRERGDHLRRFVDHVRSLSEYNTETLDVLLPRILDADERQLVREISSREGISSVVGANSSAATMAVVLAQSESGELDRSYARQELKNFLDQSLDQSFLGRGLAIEAATWLKIAYGRSEESPANVIPKAYLHLR